MTATTRRSTRKHALRASRHPLTHPRDRVVTTFAGIAPTADISASKATPDAALHLQASPK